MAEVWFYHLEQHRLEQVLPGLVERSLERGWRAAIQAASEERMHALDLLLWTYSDESFVPHGSARDGDGARQPVYLTIEADDPNAAHVRFCVDGADPTAALDLGAKHARVAVMFDGRDDAALVVARQQWASLKNAAHSRAYWQADATGRWTKKA